MINFDLTQDSKKIIKDANGVEFVDFLQRDLGTIDSAIPPTPIDYYLVTKDTSMRIDLISKAMYGYIDAAEKILKFNQWSNPLSLNEGDVLLIYDLYTLTRNMRDASNRAEEKEDIRNQYLTPEKASKIDPTLQEFNKREQPKKPEAGGQPALPPNYADFGDKEIQIRNGKLYFGPNVTKSKKECEDPLSKSEFVARLIKNRINNR
jgi:hypothetical protein